MFTLGFLAVFMAGPLVASPGSPAVWMPSVAAFISPSRHAPGSTVKLPATIFPCIEQPFLAVRIFASTFPTKFPRQTKDETLMSRNLDAFKRGVELGSSAAS